MIYYFSIMKIKYYTSGRTNTMKEKIEYITRKSFYAIDEITSKKLLLEDFIDYIKRYYNVIDDQSKNIFSRLLKQTVVILKDNRVESAVLPCLENEVKKTCADTLCNSQQGSLLIDGELTHNNNNRAIYSGNKIPQTCKNLEDQHTNKKQPIKQNKDTEILTWKTLDVRVKNHGSSRPKK